MTKKLNTFEELKERINLELKDLETVRELKSLKIDGVLNFDEFHDLDFLLYSILGVDINKVKLNNINIDGYVLELTY